MVDEHTIFGGFLTDIGKVKNAKMLALQRPWEIVRMLVGDANDTDPKPEPDQRELINLRYRARLNQLYIDPDNSNVIIAEMVIPPEVGGWWIRELALEDDDGDIVAVANCAPSYKPKLQQGSGRTQIIRMHIAVSNTANIVLNLVSATLATRDFVYSYAAKINHTHPARGIPGTYVFPGGTKIPRWSLRCPTMPTTLSRKEYGDLFRGITAHTAIKAKENSHIVESIQTYSGMEIGNPVCGPGIAKGTTIINIEGNHIALSNRIEHALFGTSLWAAPWGVGDGETTFGMPWFAEDTPLVQANGNVATSTKGSVILHGHALNINSGGQSAAHVHAVGDPGHAHAIQGNSYMGNSGGGDTMNFNSSPRNNPTSVAGTGIYLGANNVDHYHNTSGNTNGTGGPLNLPAGTRSSICVWY